MLIEFRVGNFRSFSEIATFSLLAAPAMKEFEESNVIQRERYRLLRSAVIYGANASGKSNLLSALRFMRWFIHDSSKERQANEKIPISPFKLDASTENSPSHFEITSLIDKRRWRYGFEADQHRIHKEWLLYADKNKETLLFSREMDNIDVREGFTEGKGLAEKTRENALFLSVAANFNGRTARSILGWFDKSITVHGKMDMSNYRDMSVDLLRNESSKSILVSLLKEADLGIDDVNFEEDSKEMDVSELHRVFSENFIMQTGIALQRRVSLRTVHKKYENGAPSSNVQLSMIKEESDGTLRFFDLIGLVFKSLSEGSLMIADELESSLHPLLTRKLIQLYQSPKTNPNNAQLIFTTHDTNVLALGRLRRDQIWLTEKNEQGATDLYSLAEFKPGGDEKKVRNDEAFAKNYIAGRYGAIPFIGDFDSLVKRFLDDQQAVKEK